MTLLRSVLPLLAATAATAATASIVSTLSSPASALPPGAPRPAAAPVVRAVSVFRADPAPDGIETDRVTRAVTPGVRLLSYDRLEAGRRLRLDELDVDLAQPGLRAEYLGPGRGTLAELVARHRPGPGRRVVAAVNGDFFDIGRTGAPLGPGLAGGLPLHSPAPGAGAAIGFGPGPVGRVLRLTVAGALGLPAGTRPLTAYNAARLGPDAIGAYTSAWGGVDRGLLATGPGERAAEVLVRDGRVTSTAAAPGSGPLPAGTTALVGRGGGGAALRALRAGDPVTVAVDPRADSGPLPATVLGGRETLVAGGVPRNHEGLPNNTAAPRTAVGFSRDGRRMRIVTAEGRRAESTGLTLTQLALLMRQSGMHDALNLDGGGSATLLAVRSGDRSPQLENTPSDGRPRTVPNGLVLTVPAGDGRLAGYRVEAPAGSLRTFPGLTRRLTATGHDAAGGPAPGTPHWHTAPTSGRVDGAGTFHATRPGTTEVHATHTTVRAAAPGPTAWPAGGPTGLAVGGRTAWPVGRAPVGPAPVGLAGGPAAGTVRGSVTVTVLGALDRIAPSVSRIALADAAASARFTLTGYDAHGAAAPVEPADVVWEYDRRAWRVSGDDAGGFTLTALKPRATGTVRATVAGHRAELAVSAGLRTHSLPAFTDPAGWSVTGGRIRPVPAPGPGLALAYEQAAGAAEIVARAPRPLPLPADPRALTLRMSGDDGGVRTTLRLRDATGTPLLLRPATPATGTEPAGPRSLRFPVPDGERGRLFFDGISLTGTGPVRGAPVFEALAVDAPPYLRTPAPAPPRTPVLATDARVRARAWRFAVLSVPGSGPAARERLRRGLAAVGAARPDLVLLAADETPADGPGAAVPRHRVPGPAFSHRGTRFLSLEATACTLRGGGLARLKALRTGLAAAARDPAVGAVVVLRPALAPGCVDSRESALLERAPAEFRRTTGKGAAVIETGAPAFAARLVEGVPWLADGSATAPAQAPAWYLAGVDPVPDPARTAARRTPWAGGPDWFSAALRIGGP